MRSFRFLLRAIVHPLPIGHSFPDKRLVLKYPFEGRLCMSELLIFIFECVQFYVFVLNLTLIL